MKQKDIALIAVVAIISATLSFILSGKLFVTPENRQQNVQVIDKITADFTAPDKRFFNENSINPTVDTTLDNTNQTPFNSKQ